MSSFHDNSNRLWVVSLTVDDIKRVRSLTGEDLARVMSGSPSLLDKLCGDSEGNLDIITLCDILYAVCKPQLDKAGISDVEFGRAMGGDAICSGQRALMEELQLFFSGLGRAETAKAIENKQELVARAIEVITEGISRIDPKISIPGPSFTPAPESSESTPARSLSPS